MSLNTAHANNGVLLHAGEYILLHCDNVTMEFSGQDLSTFKGSKHGRIYLTSHRIIFNSKKENELNSFSAPFILLSDVTLEQPVLSANYIKGKVRAQPNGNFIGEVKFKLHFKSGGAIEYGQALLRAASTAQSNMRNSGFSDDPPPYTPSGNWHEAPPPAYQPPPGYYGWIPQHDAFSGPAPNTVFVSDNPPPYPGIGGPTQYAQHPSQPAQQYTPANVYNPQQQQASPAAVYNAPQTTTQNNDDLPSWNGFSAPPPEPEPQQQAQNGAPSYQHPPPYGQGYGAPNYGAPAYGAPVYGASSVPSYGAPSAPGYGPPGAPGYGPPGGPGYGAPGAPGYGPPGAPMYGRPGASGYGAPGAPGYGVPPYPPANNPYPPPGGAPAGAAASAYGFSAPPNSKEAEALASASNTTFNQRGNVQRPSDMPPSYDDLPPPNYDAARKNQ